MPDDQPKREETPREIRAIPPDDKQSANASDDLDRVLRDGEAKRRGEAGDDSE